MPNKNKKDNGKKTKSKPIKLRPRDINKTTRNMFKLKEKKSNGTGQ